MSDFFKQPHGEHALAAERAALDETAQRWRDFARKIQERADLLYTQGMAETLRLKQTRLTVADNEAYLFWSGVCGQIRSLRDKLASVFEDSVAPVFREPSSRAGSATGARALWHALQAERNALDEHLSCRGSVNFDAFDDADDPEESYRQLLEAFRATREGFACSNCGAHVTLNEVFFLSTYVDCAYCRTRNTFYPDSAASTLPWLAERLAQRRSQSFHDAWQQAEREVPIWSVDHAAVFHERRRRAVALYIAYIHRKHDELDKVVPALKPHNDLIRHSRIEEKRRTLAG